MKSDRMSGVAGNLMRGLRDCGGACTMVSARFKVLHRCLLAINKALPALPDRRQRAIKKPGRARATDTRLPLHRLGGGLG